MALTLIEAAKVAKNNDQIYRAGIIETYANADPIMQIMPFETINGNTWTFSREQSLPGVAFRGVNETYDESTGKIELVSETLSIAGGYLDVDKFILKTQGMEQRTIQENMKVKSLALDIAKTFIKGSVMTDEKSFDGIQARIGADANQLIAAGTTASGTALSLNKLNKLIDAVTRPTCLVMNRTLRSLLSEAAHTTSVGGYITWNKNEFGQRILYYGDLPIITTGKDNTNAEILAFDEACYSGSSVGTSIYCLSLGEDGVKAIQYADMEVKDLGELQTKPSFRTEIEWYVGMVIQRTDAAARLYSIKEATVTL